LYSVYGRLCLNVPCPFTRSLDMDRANVLLEAVERGVNSPWTSSLGRLFDAVAALSGLRYEVSFEGQAAMALEGELPAAGGSNLGRSYRFALVREGGKLLVDSRPMVRELVDDLNSSLPVPLVSLKFHRAAVNALAASARVLREGTGVNRVVLAGGCFQNAFLLGGLEKRLKRDGFLVLSPGRVPAGDGGLSVGQAAVALARLEVKSDGRLSAVGAGI